MQARFVEEIVDTIQTVDSTKIERLLNSVKVDAIMECVSDRGTLLHVLVEHLQKIDDLQKNELLPLYKKHHAYVLKGLKAAGLSQGERKEILEAHRRVWLEKAKLQASDAKSDALFEKLRKAEADLRDIWNPLIQQAPTLNALEELLWSHLDFDLMERKESKSREEFKEKQVSSFEALFEAEEGIEKSKTKKSDLRKIASTILNKMKLCAKQRAEKEEKIDEEKSNTDIKELEKEIKAIRGKILSLEKTPTAISIFNALGQQQAREIRQAEEKQKELEETLAQQKTNIARFKACYLREMRRIVNHANENSPPVLAYAIKLDALEFSILLIKAGADFFAHSKDSPFQRMVEKIEIDLKELAISTRQAAVEEKGVAAGKTEKEIKSRLNENNKFLLQLLQKSPKISGQYPDHFFITVAHQRVLFHFMEWLETYHAELFSGYGKLKEETQKREPVLFSVYQYVQSKKIIFDKYYLPFNEAFTQWSDLEIESTSSINEAKKAIGSRAAAQWGLVYGEEKSTIGNGFFSSVLEQLEPRENEVLEKKKNIQILQETLIVHILWHRERYFSSEECLETLIVELAESKGAEINEIILYAFSCMREMPVVVTYYDDRPPLVIKPLISKGNSAIYLEYTVDSRYRLLTLPESKELKSRESKETKEAKESKESEESKESKEGERTGVPQEDIRISIQELEPSLFRPRKAMGPLRKKISTSTSTGNCCGTTLIVSLAMISAINSYLVRFQKTDELLKDYKNEPLQFIFDLMNVLAIAPEAIYNIKRNRHAWLSFWNTEHKVNSPQSAYVTQSRSCRLSPAKKNGFSRGGILGVGLLTAMGHWVLFFDAEAWIFTNKYGIQVDPKENPKNMWFVFLIAASFGAVGALQEWLHSARELAESAEQDWPLFCNSSTVKERKVVARPFKCCSNINSKTIFENFMYDLIVNGFVLLACFAEFGLFSYEIDENIEKLEKMKNRPWWIEWLSHFFSENKNFVNLTSAVLALMSASMYLGHEGKMFIRLLSKGFFKAEKCWCGGEEEKSEVGHPPPLNESASGYFYKVSVVPHVLVHAISRYWALSKFFSGLPFLLKFGSVIVSGISRGAILLDDGDEDKPYVDNRIVMRREPVENEGESEQKIPENSVAAMDYPKKYTAGQRGEDAAYEFVFILTAIGLNYRVSTGLDKNCFLIMALPGVLAELLGDLLGWLGRRCSQKNFQLTPEHGVTFVINILTPLATAGLTCELIDGLATHTDFLYEAPKNPSPEVLVGAKKNQHEKIAELGFSAAILLTLTLRHWLKKFLLEPHFLKYIENIGCFKTVRDFFSAKVENNPANVREQREEKKKEPSICNKITNFCYSFWSKPSPTKENTAANDPLLSSRAEERAEEEIELEDGPRPGASLFT